MLTTRQIHNLFFASTYDPGATPSSRCKFRLRGILEKGLIERQEQAQKPSLGRLPLLNYLAPAGKERLEAEFGIEANWAQRDNNLTDSDQLKHLLLTNEAWIVLELACRMHDGIEIVESYHDQRLERPFLRPAHPAKLTGSQGGIYHRAFQDDGYNKIRYGRKNSPYYRFFIEVDRGTETLAAGRNAKRQRTTWRTKTRSYNDFIESGACEKQYGSSRVRILTITLNQHRARSMKRVTEEAGGQRRFWFTSFDQFRPEHVFFDPIWDVATSTTHKSLLAK